MKINITTLFVLATSFFISSCSKKSDKSDKFIGTWQNTKVKDFYFTIAKEGTNIIYQEHLTGTYAQNGDEVSEKYSATYNKEQDKLELNTELGPKDINYVQASQHLLKGAGEFQKVNEPPSFKEAAKRADSMAVIEKAIQSSSFEDDVIKMANYRCEIQKLKAKDPSDEKAQKDLEALTKEIDGYRKIMSKKYADKKDDKEMNDKADKIMSDILAKCN